MGDMVELKNAPAANQDQKQQVDTKTAVNELSKVPPEELQKYLNHMSLKTNEQIEALVADPSKSPQAVVDRLKQMQKDYRYNDQQMRDFVKGGAKLITDEQIKNMSENDAAALLANHRKIRETYKDLSGHMSENHALREKLDSHVKGFAKQRDDQAKLEAKQQQEAAAKAEQARVDVKANAEKERRKPLEDKVGEVLADTKQDPQAKAAELQRLAKELGYKDPLEMRKLIGSKLDGRGADYFKNLSPEELKNLQETQRAVDARFGTLLGLSENDKFQKGVNGEIGARDKAAKEAKHAQEKVEKEQKQAAEKAKHEQEKAAKEVEKKAKAEAEAKAKAEKEQAKKSEQEKKKQEHEAKVKAEADKKAAEVAKKQEEEKALAKAREEKLDVVKDVLTNPAGNPEQVVKDLKALQKDLKMDDYAFRQYMAKALKEMDGAAIVAGSSREDLVKLQKIHEAIDKFGSGFGTVAGVWENDDLQKAMKAEMKKIDAALKK